MDSDRPWITERVALGEEAQLLAKLAADMNPVLRRDFHEIDVGRRIGHELVGQRPAQSKAGALNRVFDVFRCYWSLMISPQSVT